MLEKYCTKCGKKLPMDARFCLYCGAAITDTSAPEKSGLVTAGGILTIIAASFSAFDGFACWMIGVPALSNRFSGYYGTGYGEILIAIGILAFVSFAFALVSGIQSLRRKMFDLILIGIVLLLLTSIMHFITLSVSLGGIILVLLFAVPIFVLSLLSLVFVTIRKKEFT